MAINGIIYQAKEKANLLFYWGIVSGTFITVGLIIGIQWGIMGVTWAYFVIAFVLGYINFNISFRLIELKFSDFLSVLWKTFFCSMMMFSVLFCIKFLIPEQLSAIGKLSILTVSGIVIYSALAWIFNKKQFVEIIKTVSAKI